MSKVTDILNKVKSGEMSVSDANVKIYELFNYSFSETSSDNKPSKAMRDYEFSIFRRSDDTDLNINDDDHGGIIKHFGD